MNTMKSANLVFGDIAAVATPAAANRDTRTHEDYHEVGMQKGAVRGRRFAEYYEDATDRTFLGNTRPFTAPSSDDGQDSATASSAYELFRAAGAVPDKFRSLAIRDEVLTYVNMTEAAQSDLLEAARADILASMHEQATPGAVADGEMVQREKKKEEDCPVIRRVREAWSRAVEMALPGNKRSVKAHNGFVRSRLPSHCLFSDAYVRFEPSNSATRVSPRTAFEARALNRHPFAFLISNNNAKTRFLNPVRM